MKTTVKQTKLNYDISIILYCMIRWDDERTYTDTFREKRLAIYME